MAGQEKKEKYSYLKGKGLPITKESLTWAFSAGVLLYSVLVYLLVPVEKVIFYDLAFIFAGLAATIASFFLWKMEASFEGNSVTPSTFLFFGNLSFTIAEGIWMMYESILGIETPLPSFADLFWILGYLLFFLFLVKKVWTAFPALPLLNKAGAFIFLVGSLLVGYFAIISRFIFLNDWDLVSKVIGVTYVAGDLLIISGVVVLILAFSGGSFFLPNIFLSAGFVLFALADIFYYDLEIKGTYATGALSDFGWTLGYILIAAFALETMRILRKISSGD